MKITDLQKSTATDDLDKLIDNLERDLAQRQRDLETAKRFRDALPRLTGAQTKSVGKSMGVKTQLGLDGKREYGKTTDAIRAAIKACPNRYDIYDIEKALETRGTHIPRMIISQTLSRLIRTKKLHVKRKGKGRRPTMFTKEGTLNE